MKIAQGYPTLDKEVSQAGFKFWSFWLQISKCIPIFAKFDKEEIEGSLYLAKFREISVYVWKKNRKIGTMSYMI